MLMFRDTPGVATSPGEPRQLALGDLWRTALRHKWLVAGVAATVVAIAAVYTRSQAPVYSAGASMRIDDPRRSQRMLSDILPIGGMGSQTIETEMLVLQSRQIAEAVVDSLALQVTVADPQQPRGTLFQTVQAPRTAGSGNYELKWNAGRKVYTVQRGRGAAGPVPAEVRVGVPFNLAGVTLNLRPELRAAPPEHIDVSIAPFRNAVAALQGTLMVARVSRDATIVNIRYQNHDPEMAAAVPNAVATSFVAYKTRATKTESHSTVEFLRTQVATYEQQLASAELRLKSFRENARVVNPEVQASEQVKRLADLQTRTDEMRLERESLARALVQARTAPTGEAAYERYRNLASFPTFLRNPSIQDVMRSLTEFENRRTELLLRRQEASPEVQAVEARIRELQDGLYNTSTSYLQGLDNQLSSLQTTLGRFGQELSSIPATEIEYARLLRQQKLLEELYTLLQTRLKEAEISEAVEPGDIRVVDSALVPELPSAPRPLRNLFFAGVMGLFLGLAAAFIRESLDTKVRTLEDAQSATSGLPALATIPSIPTAAPANGNGRKQRGPVVPVPAEAMLGESVITRRDPHSPVSEAYRALRTSVTFAGVDRPPQVVVITSAMPGDGKSTSAANLAITLAQQGIRTLLVDADLRRGLLHRLFGAKEQPGLTNVLHMGLALEQAVQQVDAGNGVTLDFLSSGPLPPNPAEILGSDRMRRLLDQMRSGYEAVIFDAPPLNLVTDAAVLGKVVDTTILIARANVTDQRALRHAASQLHMLHVPVAGLVLNDVDISTSSYYGYGKYGYHRN